jgi:hypothetical protein
MNKIKNKLVDLFYKSYLGGLYFEILLFVDRVTTKKKFYTPKELAQVVRESSQTIEGVRKIKKAINGAVTSRDSKVNTHEALLMVEDLATLAKRDPSSTQSQTIEFIKNNMDLSNSDIKSDTDKAKMVEKRIDDYKQLHEHIVKRNALREARKNQNGK